jgi:hypothetical protein
MSILYQSPGVEISDCYCVLQFKNHGTEVCINLEFCQNIKMVYLLTELRLNVSNYWLFKGLTNVIILRR